MGKNNKIIEVNSSNIDDFIRVIKKNLLKNGRIKEKTIKKELKPKYQAILEMVGLKYTGEGETLFDAINAIKLEWHDIKGKGVMTIIYGKQKAEHLFYIKQLKMIFANKIAKQMWAKRLALFLK